MKGCIYRTAEDRCLKFSDDRSESFCVLPEPCEDRNPSNADRIRAMTDEELADWLVMNGDGSDYETILAMLREEYGVDV